MYPFCNLLGSSEEWLVDRVIYYAKKYGYVKYSSTLIEAWRLSIARTTATLTAYIEQTGGRAGGLGLDEDYARDPVASFGVMTARGHRHRGVGLVMFLGLLKYYRQSYVDLVLEGDCEEGRRNEYRRIVDCFFDRMEMGVVLEWAEVKEDTYISELTHKGRLLANEKNKFVTVCESIPSPVILLDRQGRMVYANHAAAALFMDEFSPGIIYYHGAEIPQDLLTFIQGEVISFIEGAGREHSFEKSIAAERGILHFDIKLKGMLDISGKYRGTIIIFNDITHRKKIESSLKRERDFSDTILKTTGALVVVLDTRGRIVMFNGACERVTGYSFEEVQGRFYADLFIPPREREAVAAVFDDLRAGKFPSRYENHWLAQRGEIRLIDWSNSVLRDDDGHVEYIVAVGIDITAQRQAQDALQNSNEELRAANEELIALEEELQQQVKELQLSRDRLSSMYRHVEDIIDSLPDPTFVIDNNRKVIAWNKAMEDMTGVPKKEVMGRGDYAYGAAFYGTPRPMLIDDFFLAEEERLEGQYDYIIKQGNTVYTEFFAPFLNDNKGAYLWGKASLLLDSDGNVMGAIETVRDITRRKGMEDDLLREKEHLKVTLSSIGDGVITVDAGGIITMLNPVARTLTGYDESEALGRPLEEVFNIINEYTRRPAENPVQKVLTLGQIVGLANHTALIARDGAERSIADSAAPIKDLAGNILGVILVFRDVTEDRALEEALRKSEERFRMLAENAWDIIYRMQIYPSPGYEYISPAVTGITGYSAEELYSTPLLLYEMIHPEDRFDWAMFLESTPDFSRPLIMRWMRKDGDLIWVEQRIAPVYDAGGSLVALEGIARDITERKRAEDLLRRYQILSQSARDIILFMKRDGQIIEANHAAENTYGYTRDELLNMNILALRDDKQNTATGFLLEQAHTTGIQFEGRHLRKDGSVFPVEISSQGAYIGNERVIVSIIRDITNRRRVMEKLRASEEMTRTVLNSITAHIAVLDQQGVIKAVNKSWEDFALENQGADLSRVGIGANYLETCRKAMGLDQDTALDAYSGIKRVLSGEMEQFRLEYPCHSPGKKRWFLMHGVRQINGEGVVISHIDITDRKLAEENLRIAHRQLQDIIEFLPDATFVIDQEKRVIAWNRTLEEMTGVRKEEIIAGEAYSIPFFGKPTPMLIDCIYEKGMIDKDIFKEHFINIKDMGDKICAESYVSRFNNGQGAMLWAMASPLYDSDGNLVGAIESLRDITERIQMEKQLEYLSMHDTLTDLYNRTCFEQEMRVMENHHHICVGIIVCDIDGLKLVNDTLGHAAGDRLLQAAARVIRGCFRQEDLIARVGGDEFSILLKNYRLPDLERACRRIEDAAATYNNVHQDMPLSISAGFAVREKGVSTGLAEIFKEADNNMYRKKLHNKQSTRSSIVQTLMKALEARDFITEGHADRLQELVAGLGFALGLPERSLTDLRLLAQFHDIGKVGIPDRILFKPGPLNTKELKEMRRHCEIGNRIALSAPDLIPIADWILKHHEWWNGKGYPLGLKGDDIPLECRILAIADAYDAMTSDRPYRRAMALQDAVTELEKNAGTQFDPHLVRGFVHIVKGDKTGS